MGAVAALRVLGLVHIPLAVEVAEPGALEALVAAERVAKAAILISRVQRKAVP